MVARSEEVLVSLPVNIQHSVHVDQSFGWHVHNPEASIKLEGKIGESSVGIIYKAFLIDAQYHMAVQIVEGDGERDDLQRIQREISVWQRLRHPNVINYFGSYAIDESLWVFMDICRLGSVFEIMEISSRCLYEKEIACICAGTLRALDFVHNQYHPIIHKDIKSASIQLTEKGEIKLGNFGISQAFRGMGHMLEGTPHFMAPEVSATSKFTPAADIWSLGIAAIEMAEGSPPYWDVKPMRAIGLIKKKEPPTLKNPDKWSPAFVDFVRRCLVKDHHRRPTAEELLTHPFIVNAKEKVLKKLCQQTLKAKKKGIGTKLGTLRGTLKGTFKFKLSLKMSWKKEPYLRNGLNVV